MGMALSKEDLEKIKSRLSTEDPKHEHKDGFKNEVQKQKNSGKSEQEAVMDAMLVLAAGKHSATGRFENLKDQKSEDDYADAPKEQLVADELLGEKEHDKWVEDMKSNPEFIKKYGGYDEKDKQVKAEALVAKKVGVLSDKYGKDSAMNMPEFAGQTESEMMKRIMSIDSAELDLNSPDSVIEEGSTVPAEKGQVKREKEKTDKQAQENSREGVKKLKEIESGSNEEKTESESERKYYTELKKGLSKNNILIGRMITKQVGAGLLATVGMKEGSLYNGNIDGTLLFLTKLACESGALKERMDIAMSFVNEEGIRVQEFLEQIKLLLEEMKEIMTLGDILQYAFDAGIIEGDM